MTSSQFTLTSLNIWQDDRLEGKFTQESRWKYIQDKLFENPTDVYQFQEVHSDMLETITVF